MADETLPEEWRPIEGWPYEVSDLGRVRRATNAYRRGYVMMPAGRVLRPMSTRHGYLFVNLFNDRHIKKTFLVHRIVCAAFHGAPPTTLHEVAHWDGDRTNNYAGNLRWATSAENSADLIRHGHSTRGSRQKTAKLTEDQVLEIRRLAVSGITQTTIAARFGVSRSRIANIKTRRDWAWLP